MSTSDDVESNVIVQISHPEPAAHIPEDVGAAIQAATIQTFVSNARFADQGNDTENVPQMSLSDDSEFEEEPEEDHVLIVRYVGVGRQFFEQLANGSDLAPVRALMAKHKMVCRNPGGAYIFVHPDQYLLTLRSLHDVELKPFHVVISSTLKPQLDETVKAARCGRCRVKEADITILALTPAWHVKNTFYDIQPEIRRSPHSVTQSSPGAPNHRCMQCQAVSSSRTSGSVSIGNHADGTWATIAHGSMVWPTIVSGDELAMCPLPARFSRRVFRRLLECVDAVNRSCLVIMSFDVQHGGVAIGTPRWPYVSDLWTQLSLDLFDDLPVAALSHFHRDGASIVHPRSAGVQQITVDVLYESDPHFDVQGGVRHRVAFCSARHRHVVTIYKKMKPESDDTTVQTGYVSVFSPPLLAGDHPVFLRCMGPTGIKIEPEELDMIKSPQRRRAPAGEVFEAF